MATEMSGVIDEIIRKRKINSKIPKQILDDLNALELNISHLEELQRSFPNLTASTSQKVSQIDFKILKNRIFQEKETWEILWKRLNRDTVNIGVIGLARQGKSTFLQKVSGLTDNEIPSSDRMPCTSVQSNIYHADQNTQAKVYFHSESSFLEQVIKPYYEDLGFSNFPKSVSEFRNSPFPSKPTNPRHPAKAEAV
jgi:ribosome-binding ATPase YchF (GTP1/OBG family)